MDAAMSEQQTQTHVFDVVVVGSGAGGMLAACRAADRGLSVVVLEKSDVYGGTSAVSGGGIWIPCNHHIAELGVTDTREAARTYIDACTQGVTATDRIDAYLDTAPEMLRYVEAKTRSIPCRWTARRSAKNSRACACLHLAR
jgi:3-oxosteroid 1-dehydrogenase